MYFCALDGMAVVGSSPEALVRLAGREAFLRPIAGTRPRGADAERDIALERELLDDPKEAAEHVMLVDLARNDLGRVAVTGSVRVDPFRTVERYSHVMHLVSGVRGVLAPEHDAFELFAASFPAGTVVGAPKIRAMELIDTLEPTRRGVYAGTVGYFGHGGAMDQAIAIRTLVFEGDRYSYQAGAGIVADSLPEREHDEVLAKGAALEAALKLAEEEL
jgi:anthranilate synthase component 1